VNFDFQYFFKSPEKKTSFSLVSNRPPGFPTTTSTNGHGDVVQVLNANGNIVNSYTYDEWGNILSKTEQISNPIRYAGEYYDEESGLYYLRARYYDPAIGRFISEDSNEGEINNPLSLNLYTYCENDPIIYSDPTGNYAAYVVQALESPYGQEIIAAAKALGMKVGQYVSLYGPLIENKAIAAVDKGKKAVSRGSKWLKGKLSSSGGQDPNKFKGTGKTGIIEKHHLLPQQFKKQFKKAGLDIEKYKILLDKADHRLKPGGLHTGANNWNKQWADFFKRKPNATKDQILNQLNKMMKDFGLK
jgi:RHS repeat-associated protein